MKRNMTNIQEPETPIVMSMRVTAGEHRAMQKAWQRTGEYSNRSQWIKAALNSFAGEEIFR